MSTLAGTRDSAGAASPRALAVNYFLLSGGEILAKVAAFFAFTQLGRVLGAVRYGSVEFAIALLVFFSLPGAFGLEAYGAREIARRRDGGLQGQLAFVREIMILRFGLALASLAVLAGAIWMLPRSVEDKQLIAAYGASLLLLPCLTHWFFQGHDNMAWSSLLSIVRNSAFAVLVLALFRATQPLYHVGVYECGAVAVTALAGFWGLRRFRTDVPPVRVPLSHLRAHLAAAAPIGLSNLLWACMWYLPTLVLGLWAEPRALGEFGVAHRITISLHTFVWLYFVNLLPSLSRAVRHPAALRDLLSGSLTISSWGALLVALVGIIAAGPLVGVAYGAAFHGAAQPLAALIAILPIVTISGHYSYLLVAAGQQKWLMRWSLLAAAVTFATARVLAPRAGSLAGACAILAGGLVQLIFTCQSVRAHVVDLNFWQPLARPLAAFAVALGLYQGLALVSPAGAGMASLAIFLLALWIFERHRLPQAMALFGRPPRENSG
jgi:O-antigen/teichoic acid export membrane protein